MSFLILIMVFAAYTTTGTGMAAAFISGLMLDMWDANPLGQSSLIFLAASFAINLYKRKFNATSFFFLITMGTLTLIFSEIIEKKQFLLSFEELVHELKRSVITVTVVTFVLRLWDRRFEEKKLSV